MWWLDGMIDRMIAEIFLAGLACGAVGLAAIYGLFKLTLWLIHHVAIV